MELTSKQRAFLRRLAGTMEPVQYIGKASLTDENIKNIEEALAARELIKLGVLKNCDDDPREIAEAAAAATHSTVVTVIGKKFVLYRQGRGEKRKIELPNP